MPNMKLVLVESPTKARKISSYLGSPYVVKASVGHIRDLPKSKMGVDIEHNFQPEYLIPKDKSKVVKELKSLAEGAEQIIIATDPDREGEAIGWHLQQILSGAEEKVKTKKAEETRDAASLADQKKRFVRATFHEITKSAILDAIAHPTQLNMDLVDAQQARRVVDRLVGYSVSPVLWKKIRYGLSAGRVQSVALRLIAEREREILAFVPEEYWELDVLLDSTGKQKTKISDEVFAGKVDLPEGGYVGRVSELNGKAFDPHAEIDVQPVLQQLDKASYKITSIEKKERTRVSLPPLTTSTLQQQAATRFGYTSKATMRLAQQLYEEGLITYHRTDSVNLSTQALDAARGYIETQFGKQYLPAQPKYFSTKTKNAQEAHEAIRPTDTSVPLDAVRAKLGDQHAKVYDLIWRRFMGSQMNAAVYDQTTVLTEATTPDSNVLKLRSNGSILKFDGWMKLFPNQGDVLLPDLHIQEVVEYVQHLAAQKFTQPPPRYNDASLIKMLEQEGIGRPSTYASIISVIEDRGYVQRKEKKFLPSPVGLAVNDFLNKHFTTIVDYKFTANMEDDLDAVSRGEKEWHKIVADFYTPLEKTVTSVIDTAERAQVPVEKTGEVCPLCGPTEHGEIVIRSGRFGKFKSCSRFPECNFTENIVNKVDGLLCPLCQKGEVVIKPTRFGKDFFSCSRYPDCDWANWSKPTPETRLTQEQWDKMKEERAARKVAWQEKHPNQAAKAKAGKAVKTKTKKSTKVKNSAKKKPVKSKITKKTTPKTP